MATKITMTFKYCMYVTTSFILFILFKPISGTIIIVISNYSFHWYWRYHRNIEWLGLKRTLKVIRFQLHCHRVACHPLDQVGQAPIQLGLEHLQGWDGTFTTSCITGSKYHCLDIPLALIMNGK